MHAPRDHHRIKTDTSPTASEWSLVALCCQRLLDAQALAAIGLGSFIPVVLLFPEWYITRIMKYIGFLSLALLLT